MFTEIFAIENGFKLIHHKDGCDYWLKYISEDSFYQIHADGSKIQYYDGDVFDLTFDQLVRELSK